MRSERRFLSAIQSGISSPVLSAPYRILLGIGRLGRLKPFAYLGLQLGGALLHALIAHRLVLRGIGFDLGAVERNMAELHQAGGLAQVQNLTRASSASKIRLMLRQAPR